MFELPNIVFNPTFTCFGCRRQSLTEKIEKFNKWSAVKFIFHRLVRYNEDDFICENPWQNKQRFGSIIFVSRLPAVRDFSASVLWSCLLTVGRLKWQADDIPVWGFSLPSLLMTGDGSYYYYYSYWMGKAPTLAPLARWVADAWVSCGWWRGSSHQPALGGHLPKQLQEWTAGPWGWQGGFGSPSTSASSSTTRLRPATTQLCSTGTRSDCHDDGICEG